VAAFTAPACVAGTPCTFTDASTDADGTISTRAWDFGDGNTGSGATATNTYAAAGTYQVKLTVTDNGGASDDQTNTVTVTGGTGGQAPTSSFDLPQDCTAGTPCGFHSTSTDPDGDITAATFVWNFGDNGTANTADATHTFAQPGTYTVTLNVTDVQGLSATSNQQLTVTPAASQDCTLGARPSGQRVVNCNLVVSQRSTVKFTIESRSCQLSGNSLDLTAPRAQNVFFNLCNRTVGEEKTLVDANGLPLVVDPGATLALQFGQGTASAGDPTPGDPGIQVEVISTDNWRLRIDDGGAPGVQGEPDFNDAIINVTATAAP
jgi:PKD repeat protein